MKTTQSLEFDRQHAISVFVNGVNAPESTALVLTYLARYRPRRLDDGEVHDVLISYTPPTGGETDGRLELSLDGLSRPLLTLPITLPLSINGEAHPGSVGAVNGTAAYVGADRAYVGFTAATGEASEKHDIIRAAFCHKAGCAAI